MLLFLMVPFWVHLAVEASLTCFGGFHPQTRHLAIGAAMGDRTFKQRGHVMVSF